jgi:hypothetical protein
MHTKGAHDRTDHRQLFLHLRTQRLIGRGRAGRDARAQVRQAAARDVQPALRPQDPLHFAQGQAEALVAPHGQRRGLRAEMRAGGAERVGRLQRMAALHPAPAGATRADVHAKGAHDRTDHGELLLYLGGRVRHRHRAATIRARRRHGRLVLLVDLRGPRAVRPAPIRPTGTTPWRAARALPTGFRKRRRLAKAGAPRGVELILQAVVAALQSIAVAFDIAARPLGAREFLAQPRDLVDQLIAGQTVVRGALARHANVMPVPSHLYKYGILDSQRRPSPHPLNKDRRSWYR